MRMSIDEGVTILRNYLSEEERTSPNVVSEMLNSSYRAYQMLGHHLASVVGYPREVYLGDTAAPALANERMLDMVLRLGNSNPLQRPQIAR